MPQNKSSDNLKLSIVRASRDDLTKILSLESRIYMPCLFSRSQLRYLLSSPTAITFLCYDDGVPVGYGIALRSKLRNGLYKGRIYYLGVIPEYRYKGAGSMLLGAMEEYLIKTGVSFIVLETAKGNNGAETFFSKHGYMEAAFLPQYYPAGDGVRLKKIITTG